MGAFSVWHVLVFATVALVLFGGRGKVSDLMGDFGKGINSFKKGLRDPEQTPRIINSESGEIGLHKKGLAEPEKDPRVINSEPGQTASNTNKDTVQR